MPWLVKKASSAASEIQLVLTPVDGKVFELQRKTRLQKEQRKNTRDPQQVLAEDAQAKAQKEEKRAKAKAKASSKGAAKPKARSNKTTEDITEDTAKETEEVIVNGPGGSTLARPKLFLDCLILAIRSAVMAARAKFGLPFDVVKSDLDPTDERPMKYTEMEVKILRANVRAGLHFALQGSGMINGKSHKKWSSFRPALQSSVISSYEQAGVVNKSTSRKVFGWLVNLLSGLFMLKCCTKYYMIVGPYVVSLSNYSGIEQCQRISGGVWTARVFGQSSSGSAE